MRVCSRRRTARTRRSHSIKRSLRKSRRPRSIRCSASSRTPAATRPRPKRNYRKALEIAPETPIAANNLAWLIAENQGNLDEALQLATGAVSKNQTVAGFYDTLGWVYLKKVGFIRRHD